MWQIMLIVLWCFVIFEGLILLGLVRQVGVLHRMIDGLSVGGKNQQPIEGLPVGTQAPYFTIPLVGGGKRSLDDYKDAPVLFAFVQPSCSPCEKLVPHIAEQISNGVYRNLQALLISVGDEHVNLGFKSENRITLPIGLETGMEVSRAYRVNSTPHVYVIDERGTICAQGIANTDADLARMLAMLERDTHGQLDGKVVASSGR